MTAISCLKSSRMGVVTWLEYSAIYRLASATGDIKVRQIVPLGSFPALSLKFDVNFRHSLYNRSIV